MIVFDRKELLRVAEAVRSKDYDYLVENIKFCDCYEELKTDIALIVSPEKITFELKVMCVDREDKNIKKSETFTFDVFPKLVSLDDREKEILNFNEKKERRIADDSGCWFYCDLLDFLEENQEGDDVIVRLGCTHITFQIGDEEEKFDYYDVDDVDAEIEKDWYEIEIENFSDFVIVKTNNTNNWYSIFESAEAPDDWMPDRTREIEYGSNRRCILLEKPSYYYDEDRYYYHTYYYNKVHLVLSFGKLRIEIIKSGRSEGIRNFKIYFRKNEDGKWNIIVGKVVVNGNSKFTLDGGLNVVISGDISPSEEFLKLIENQEE